MQFVPVNAGRHEQSIEPLIAGTLDIRPHRIADGENPRALDRTAADRLRHSERPLVDRRIRLAGLQHAPAALRIAFGERTGAVDQAFTDMDDKIGIGGDQHQITPHGISSSVAS